MLVLVKKSEKEMTPVEVANAAQLEQLIFVWGRANVVDASTGEPFPEPAPPVPQPAIATLSVVDDPTNFDTAPDTGVVEVKPAQVEQAPHAAELTTEASPATDSGAVPS